MLMLPNPFLANRFNAYFIQGLINFDGLDHPVKLFSMRTPTTVLKNRFWYRNGVYQELTDRLFDGSESVEKDMSVQNYSEVQEVLASFREASIHYLMSSIES